MTTTSPRNLTSGSRRADACANGSVVTGTWYPSTGNGFVCTTGIGSVAVSKHHATKPTRRPEEVASP